MIGVVDYGMGNLRSVLNALHAIGERAELVRTAAEIARARSLVLPGVGAFFEAMQRLQGIEASLHAARAEGKAILGICLGMQLMAERGFEHGEHRGLGWIAGDVRPIEAHDLPVPHVGWNDLSFPRRSRLFEGIASGECAYFVHGFALVPRDPAVITARVEYGEAVCAAIEHENLFATQFHPEKSQRVGLQILRSFAAC